MAEGIFLLADLLVLTCVLSLLFIHKQLYYFGEFCMDESEQTITKFA